MKKLLLISALFFPLIFVCSFSQYGKWTELHPTIKGYYPNNVFPNRWEFGMAQLTDKKVLLFGGEVELGNTGFFANDTWIYDYEENSWTQIITKNTPSPREGHSIAQISDGKVLLFGGYYNNLMPPPNDTNIILNDTWIFDIADTNWHEIKAEHSPGKRTRHGMAKLLEGQVLLFGGSPNQTHFLNSTYIFDFNILDWQEIAIIDKTPEKRTGFGITEMEEGKILIYGGWDNHYLNDTWIFDENSRQWIEITNDNNNTIQKQNPITNLTKDYLLMFGGSGGRWDSSWVFNIKQLMWIEENIENKPIGRYMHNMAKITNGKALMFGGLSNSGDGYQNDTWMYELDSSFIDVKEIPDNKHEIKTLINSDNELILDYFLTNSGNAEIEIFNINGIFMFKSENIQTQRGWNREIIPVDKLPAGVYFVRVRSGSLNLVGKFLVY